jgi:predicted O-methyltransferase YrrM
MPSRTLATPLTQAPGRAATRLGYARYVLGNYRRARQASHELRRAAERAETPAEAVDAAFAFPPGPTSIRPVQVRSELESFAALVRSDSPRSVLEIGTAGGGTLYVLAWASDIAARILSLDIQRYDLLRKQLYRGFARPGQAIEVLRADSHLDATRTAVERFFDSRPIDLLFIDGDHSYDSVRADYERYGGLVRPGGLIAFHDIVDGSRETSGDVPRFWREIRSSLEEPRELVESWEQGGFGIGVGRRREG